MKSILTLITWCICGMTYAQINYTSVNAPKAGHKTEYKFLESIRGLDLNAVSQAGSDITWDITGGSVDGLREGFITIDQYPFKSFYPTANLASVDLDEPDTTFTVLEVNTTGLYLLGTYDTSATIVWKNKYIFIPFPLSFGLNFQNGTEADVTSGGITAKIEIQSNANVDGWGMLTTNEGTYPVLKVKTKQISEVTSSGIPLGSSTFEYHHWFASGTIGPIAEFTISETESIFTGIQNDTSIRYVHKQELVAGKDIQKSKLTLVLSPNPCSDYFHILLPEIDFEYADFNVINSEGKSVNSGNFYKGENNPIEIKSLPAGNYFVQVTLDHKTLLFDILNKQ